MVVVRSSRSTCCTEEALTCSTRSSSCWPSLRARVSPSSVVTSRMSARSSAEVTAPSWRTAALPLRAAVDLGQHGGQLVPGGGSLGRQVALEDLPVPEQRGEHLLPVHAEVVDAGASDDGGAADEARDAGS